MPTLLKLTDGEQGHNLAVTLAKYGLVPKAHNFKNEAILVNKLVTIIVFELSKN
jgi:hypothetical protein